MLDLPTLGIVGVVVFFQTKQLFVCRLLDPLVTCVCVLVCVSSECPYRKTHLIIIRSLSF